MSRKRKIKKLKDVEQKGQTKGYNMGIRKMRQEIMDIESTLLFLHFAKDGHRNGACIVTLLMPVQVPFLCILKRIHPQILLPGSSIVSYHT